MNIYKNLMKSAKIHETLLTILFIIYIVFDFATPYSLLSLVNNSIFQVIIFILTISLFFYVNPFVGILGVISILILFNRSKSNIQNLIPNEISKLDKMISYNQLTKNQNNINNITLEEQMVQKMAPPILESNEVFSFNSITGKLFNARNINESISSIN